MSEATHAHLHHSSPDAAVEVALDALRARGERVTTARRAVLDVLARTHEHLSADQVVADLEKVAPDVHRATVYRTLEMLADLGVLSHLHSTGGATVYHFASSPEGHEHLHAQCRVCGAIIVIPADALAEASVRVSRATGFAIDGPQSTLMGVCAECIASERVRGA
ncbi:transcriptional repressor [Microbacterium lacus]|uniref:Fur family transcriptional regulator n=1 Tax=Microbacterium lacus TaxID=415217 RepID=UPI00384E3857